ncbi:NifB/NifX family molybdenum-iron cluster-binding protein [bacterium]|nr:NifB/NifX family molybdenum-iron cluster-binding protein [bacterium]
MKICITSTGNNLDSLLDQRFGRCSYFIIYDVDTGEYEAVENSAVSEMHGAGIRAAQGVSQKGVKAIITGNIGPNASNVLSASGIDILAGIDGMVSDNVEQFKAGKLETLKGPNVPGHFGSGQGMQGGGMGSGMGRGRFKHGQD